MLPWMLYVVLVSLLLSGAALAAERLARLRRVPTRWLWLTTIVACLLVPATIASVSIQLPRIPNFIGPQLAQQNVVLRQMTSSALSPTVWLNDAAPQLAARPALDGFLQNAWLASSAALLLLLLLSGAYLQRHKRRWRRGVMAGTAVYITDNAGPAVVGLLRPRIAVPRWLTEWSAESQEHVIAHERSHLRGHDTRLLTAALFLLVCMPWNLPLWWQLRRLRYAIEVDCDARVLDSGHDVRTYGETLIAVCQRQSGYIGAVAGMSESPTFLEQRIKIMMRKPNKLWQANAVLLGTLSFGLVAAAAQIEPPNGGPGARFQTVDVPAEVLDSYTGSYKMVDDVPETITRQGQQLWAQLPGQPAVPIYPRSATSFFFTVTPVRIDFVSDGQGHVTGFMQHQYGMAQFSPRIDATEAQQLSAAVIARRQSPGASPGTEAAVQRFLSGLAAGAPDYGDMSPELAAVWRKQMPDMQQRLAELGPVVSVKFIGHGYRGWDTYEVVRERGGAYELRIALNSGGTIVGLIDTTGP